MSVLVEDLVKTYGSQKAVNQISFEAKKGEILGFLGPNGAGKTTTMKVITGFIPQSSGRVEVCGMDVSKTADFKNKIGYLPEHNPLYRDMYVKEYLNFLAGIHGLSNAKQRIGECIELTGLQDEQHKQIQSLSKGYRQRVGLAQAILHDPEVIILDEPTSGLDPNQLVEIRSLIKQIGKAKTVIFSTHIMQEVQALCDRVIIINKGKLVANDSIAQLQTKIAGDQMVEVEFMHDFPIEILTKIADVSAVDKIGNRRYSLVSKTDVRAALFEAAVKSENPILELQKMKSTVEDIFQKLTKDA